MWRTRLHLQIYLTILACLALVVLLSAFVWAGFGRDRSERDLIGVAERLAALTLPAVDAPAQAQEEAAEQLAAALGAELALFAPDGTRIYRTPNMIKRPRHEQGAHRLHRKGRGFAGGLTLADGRVLIVAPPRGGRPQPLLGLAALIAIIAVAVGLGAYPFTRRLTRRLEALRDGVERMGRGDLGIRTEIKGRDEIATLAASFNQTAAKIEQLVEGRRLFLAHASHELRTPLTRIRLGVEMLEKRPDAERFSALKRDLGEVDALIDALLLSSRLDAAPEIERSGSVDLLALIAEEAAHYDGCEIEGEAPPIPGDTALLRRMLRNLIDNAIIHGAAPVHITLSGTSTGVSLKFEDAGPGFAAEETEAVFQPFHRGRDRQNTPGYGLGLAIVRQIAKAHGGDVRIEPGRQGAVIVTLARQ